MGDDGAAAAGADSTTNGAADAQEPAHHDTKDWIRPNRQPEQQRASPEPRTSPPKTEVKKTEHSDKKPAPKSSAPVDDPVEEWDDGNGGKVTAKRSELRTAFARKAEIERASHEKFQKGAEARKAAEAKEQEFTRLVNALEQDPWAIHRYRMIQSGATEAQADAKINELAEQRLVKQMQRAQMTPEQIEQEKRDARLKELEDGEQERTKTEAEKRKTELKNKHKEQWDKTIGEAMVAANLAKTRATAARVARVLADHFDPETGKSIDPILAAKVARGQHQTEIRHELTELFASNPQSAIELIGPKLVKAIIELQAKAHQEFVPQARPNPTASKPKPPTRQGAPTLEDARKSLGIRRF